MSETRKATKDMTSGNPLQLIASFALPLLLGNIFQQMYNLVDTIIVGKFLGLSALSSVGATGSISFLIVGFCTGFTAGFAIPVAQSFGAKKYSEMRNFVINAAYLSAGLAIFIAVTTSLLCRTILEAMGTPADIIDGSFAYLVVIFMGIPFTVLYNYLSSMIRSLGDSKTPFVFLVISAGLNVVLDLVFIIYVNMGVAGAAWATIISQAVSGVLCLVYMRGHYRILKFEKHEKAVDTNKMRKLLVMGLPMGLQFSITAIGTIMLQSAVNALGTLYVASFTAAQKIKQFAMAPFDAFGNAVATYCSQNLGAKKFDRISNGLKCGLLLGVIYAVVSGTVLFFFGGDLALIFVDASETQVLELVSLGMKCVSYFYIALAALIIVRMTVQGLGYSGLAMLAGISELFARGIMAVAVIPVFGYIAVCFTDQVAWVAGMIVVIVEFIYAMKKIRQQYVEEN